MKEIKLTKGYIAIVDDEDFEWLSQHSWFAHVKGRKNNAFIYASTSINGKIKTMHRLILNAPDGIDVDHEDRNTLNNQRYNIRLATESQNTHKCIKRKNTSCKYFGVRFHLNGYEANICNNGKRYYLGRFKNGEDAAIKYDLKAKELYGEFARLNFPE